MLTLWVQTSVLSQQLRLSEVRLSAEYNLNKKAYEEDDNKLKINLFKDNTNNDGCLKINSLLLKIGVNNLSFLDLFLSVCKVTWSSLKLLDCWITFRDLNVGIISRCFSFLIFCFHKETPELREHFTSSIYQGVRVSMKITQQKNTKSFQIPDSLGVLECAWEHWLFWFFLTDYQLKKIKWLKTDTYQRCLLQSHNLPQLKGAV